VSIDTDRIRHVLTNLVRNATEAGQAGAAIEIVIEVEAPGRRSGRPGGHVTLLVRDRGSGMSDDVVQRLFQPFVTTKLDRGGTGLGLVLAQRFAHECNCTLTLRSTSPAGTVFALSLPILGSDVSQLPATDADAASDNPEPDLGAGNGNDVRGVALVLDDDPAIRATLGRMLERSGWHVLLAGSADAAIDTLASHSCDIMLVDWGAMNEGPGFEMHCSQLESVRPGSTTRMIVITGTLGSDLPDGLAPMVLSKPFGGRELLQAIALVLEG